MSDGISLHSFFLTGLVRSRPEQEAEPGTDALDGVTEITVFDLEMSGSNPRIHEVLEIGAVRASIEAGLPEKESYGERVRPKRIGNANPSALKVVGYAPSGWNKASDISETFPALVKLGRGSLAAGWGVSQDLAFLRELLQQFELDWPFAPYVLDVQELAKRVLHPRGKIVDRFNLGHVADRLGIGRMGEHSALADAYATYDVLLKLIERAEDMAAEPDTN